MVEKLIFSSCFVFAADGFPKRDTHDVKTEKKKRDEEAEER